MRYFIYKLQEEKYTSDKIRKLIEAIESAGPDAYKVFKNGLKETNQRHLYDELNKAESKLARESKEQNKRAQGKLKIRKEIPGIDTPTPRALNRFVILGPGWKKITLLYNT